MHTLERNGIIKEGRKEKASDQKSLLVQLKARSNNQFITFLYYMQTMTMTRRQPQQRRRLQISTKGSSAFVLTRTMILVLMLSVIITVQGFVFDINSNNKQPQLKIRYHRHHLYRLQRHNNNNFPTSSSSSVSCCSNSPIIMSSSLRDDNDSDNNDDDDFIVTSTSAIVENKKEIDVDIVDAVFRGKSKSNSKIINNQEDNDKDLPVLTRINNFLNQSFFDPDKYDEDDNSFFGKFARLIKNDYEFFETVYVGCFFIILIIITQDVLRAQMHTHTRF
jgi:hypothetical protein